MANLDDLFSASPASSTSTTDYSVPGYISAADNHNLGNVGASWFDVNPLNLPKYAGLSILSGLNSFYNTGVKVGNFLGANLQENKTDSWISSLDSDMGAYYKKNQEGIDLMGFLVTSLVPGIGGIKILNAGQKALSAAKNSGLVGSNLGTALGLKTSLTGTYIAGAAEEIIAGQATFAGVTQSGFKALAAGTYQNVLEGAAFEVMVQATMQASPILDHQSKSDILWNVATGGLLGGAIGGAFSAAKTFGAIKGAVKEASSQIQPFGSRALLQETNVPANKLILFADDLETGPTLNPGDPLYANQVKALELKQNRISLDMRATVHEMIPGQDKTLGNMIADINVGQSADDMLSHYIDTDQISRVGIKTRVEELQKEQQKSSGHIDPKLQVQYWKLTGEGMGDVLDHSPGVVNLADMVGETGLKGTRERVLATVRDYGNKISDNWNASKLPLGSGQGHLAAESRYIWAADLLKEIPEGSKVGMNDFPVLQRAFADGQLDIQLVNDAGNVIKTSFTSTRELQDYIIQAKKESHLELQSTAIKSKAFPRSDKTDLEEAQRWVSEKIGKITDSKVSAVEGTGIKAADKDYFVSQNLSDDYQRFLQSKGLSPVKGEEADPRFMPTWAKITKNVATKEVDGHEVAGMTWIKLQGTIAQAAMDNVVAKQMGEFAPQLVKLGDKDVAKSTPYGTGAGLLKFNNPSYGGPDSAVALMGSVTSRAAQAAKKTFSEAVEGPLAALARNQEAVVEWSTLNQKISRRSGQYILDDGMISGEQGLIDKNAWFTAEGKAIDGVEINELNHIPIGNEETYNLARAHVSQSDGIIINRNERAAAAGFELSRQPGLFRAIPPDPKDYPFFAFVKDPKVTGQGHTSMIFAETDAKLNELTRRAQAARPDLSIVFKKDTEDFFAARQAYDYDKTLSENYIDSSLKSSGVYSNYFTKTDPQAIADDFIRHHNKLIDVDVRETVRSYNQPAFDWWEDQAKSYSRVETSKFAGNFDKLEAEGKNPYLSYIKTGLNISRMSETPLWSSINRTLDSAVSKAVGAIQDIGRAAGDQLSPAHINEINSLLDKYGMNTGWNDAATQLLVNSSVPKGELTKFVRGANAVLSKLILGLDPLNSLVNAIGANILRSTELKQITDAIKSGDGELAGEIAKLGKIDVTDAGDLILSPAKLMAGAAKNFVSGSPELSAFYKSIGIQKTITEQFRSVLEDFTLVGTETAPVLNSKLQGAIKKLGTLTEAGEKYTGNKLAEEFNRFVSADSMRMLTDPAVARGIITPAEQIAYINTFVNRVEGNIIASQRPLAFQGPIGQAIGLFQSYQFNLMQQMFRYVSEGTAKDAGMLLGLQGTFFGLQGLPAFQAINQHIIGTASGNVDHRDAYDAIYGIAGKNLGDLLTYGLPSKILQTNLYSRGDINPRSVTILPNALKDVPIIGATVKFFGSLKDTVSKISGDANVWESVLQGIEHNGVSRPLAGLAQTLQATTGAEVPFSTSSKGTILFSNDLMSLATLSRLSGGKPLDEAIVNDGVFRIHSYEQVNRGKMQNIANAIKTSNINGQQSNEDQWTHFSAAYVAAGGKQTQFNKFMLNQIKSANTSQAEKIVSQLQNPFAQKMQLLMGGSDGLPE